LLNPPLVWQALEHLRAKEDQKHGFTWNQKLRRETALCLHPPWVSKTLRAITPNRRYGKCPEPMVQIGANQPGELCQAMRRAECECRLASARHRKALADTIERMADTDVRNLAKFLVEVITPAP
jgi:hypothetical protein